jgi:hypothetical protein
MNLRSLLDSLADIVRGCTAVEVNRDRMLACSDIDEWRRRREQPLILCKVAYAKRGRHDDQPERLCIVVRLLFNDIKHSDYLCAFFPFFPQLLPQLENTAQDADEDISIHASFMRLINNDNRVFVQQEIGREFSKKHAICHELYGRRRRNCCVISYLIRYTRRR